MCRIQVFWVVMLSSRFTDCPWFKRGGGTSFMFEGWRALNVLSPSAPFGIKILPQSEPATCTGIEPDDSRIPSRNFVYTRLLAFSWIIGVLWTHTECSRRSHLLGHWLSYQAVWCFPYSLQEYSGLVCYKAATSCIPNSLCSNSAVHLTVYLLNYTLLYTVQWNTIKQY
jgi:hypothetical protein